MAGPTGDDALQLPEPPADEPPASRWYNRRGIAIGAVAVLAFTAGLLIGNADQPGLQEQLADAEDDAAGLRVQLEEAESSAQEAGERADEVEQELADLGP